MPSDARQVAMRSDTHRATYDLYPGQSSYAPLRGVQRAITRWTLKPVKPVYAELPLDGIMVCGATLGQ
jgi:hypothetical protein